MPATTVLLSCTPDAAAIESDLVALGIQVAARSAPPTLLRDAVRSGCQAVLAWDPYPATSGLLAALDALQQHAPLPVLLFTSDAETDTLDAALRSGVHAFVVNGYAPQRLRPLLQLARARFEREATLRNAHIDLEHRYEERKLVERAKGILMSALQIPEDEAFRLLRRASMREQQRVGLVSRRVIDAARDADAVNRAGLLRMLSQRLVKLGALRLAGVTAEASQALIDESVARVEGSLGQLAAALSPATYGDLLDEVTRAWRTLAPLIAAPADAGALARSDEAAEQLLAAAEALTAALEAASPLATLAIVNRCGRQRMLSQRLAKQALLGTMFDGAAAQAASEDAVRSVQSFEAALQDLGRSPLSTPLIRDELECATAHWRQLTAALRDAHDAGARAVIAAQSETLLAAFDRLTGLYSRGAQQLFEAV
jgi:AmiR/NasT family two-component response regulator